jgi:hypothetical protein
MQRWSYGAMPWPSLGLGGDLEMCVDSDLEMCVDCDFVDLVDRCMCV